MDQERPDPRERKPRRSRRGGCHKLRLAKGAGTTDGKDFEDALHLYLTFEDQFKSEQLQAYVEQLGVEDYYAELRGV